MLATGLNGSRTENCTGRGRHQLHQSQRPLGRNTQRVTAGFDISHCFKQLGIDVVRPGRLWQIKPSDWADWRWTGLQHRLMQERSSG